MVKVNGTFGSGCLQTVRKILDAYRNGILRVRNSSGCSGVLGVVTAFGSLHRVISSAAGFLHHNGLNQQNIIRDAILLGIFADDRLIGFHLRTEGQGFGGIILLAAEDNSAAANQDNDYDHQNGSYPAGGNGCVKRLCRLCRRPGQLCCQLCGFLCGHQCFVPSGGGCMAAFLGSCDSGLLRFPEGFLGGGTQCLFGCSFSGLNGDSTLFGANR